MPTVDGNGVSGSSYGASDGDDPNGDEVIYAPEPPDPTEPGPTERVNLGAGIAGSIVGFIVFVVGVWIWVSRHYAKVSSSNKYRRQSERIQLTVV